MLLPEDPVILLSYINTQLRDYYSDLDDMCKSLNINPEQLLNTLSQIDYHYDKQRNQFI